MKKIILATTALIGLAAFAQPSLAADAPAGKLQLTLGGYVDISAGFFGTKAKNETNRDFRNTTQVQIDGEATADNGLSYGPHVEIREQGGSSSSALRFTQTWLHVAGNFGRFEVGDRRGPAYLSAVYAPTVGFGQIDSDYDSFYGDAISNQFALGAGDGTFLRVFNSNRSTKVVYYTPVFHGFQAGVSYAPEVNKGDSVVVQNSKVVRRYGDFVEGAVTYKNSFNGVDVSGAFTATHASDYNAVGTPKLGDVTAYGVGAQIGYAGFTVGGGWLDQDGAAIGGYNAVATPWRAKQAYNVGATYKTGPAGVGVSYGSQDTNDGSVNTLGAGLTYAVAPGLTVSGDYYYVENNAVHNNSVGKKDSGNFFILSTRVDF